MTRERAALLTSSDLKSKVESAMIRTAVVKLLRDLSENLEICRQSELGQSELGCVENSQLFTGQAFTRGVQTTTVRAAQMTIERPALLTTSNLNAIKWLCRSITCPFCRAQDLCPAMKFKCQPSVKPLDHACDLEPNLPWTSPRTLLPPMLRLVRSPSCTASSPRCTSSPQSETGTVTSSPSRRGPLSASAPPRRTGPPARSRCRRPIWNPIHLDENGQNGTDISEHGTDMSVHVYACS